MEADHKDGTQKKNDHIWLEASSNGKRAWDLPENRWLSRLMDTSKPRGITSALSAFWIGVKYLMTRRLKEASRVIKELDFDLRLVFNSDPGPAFEITPRPPFRAVFVFEFAPRSCHNCDSTTGRGCDLDKVGDAVYRNKIQPMFIQINVAFYE
ncbi:hypothetical protein EVAR_52807_1 [Eumeta japonica]|uniref:Uncharacterized protein n=1 Tax=Eumeta variegata TaxID=151549 RepID=A0A4C1Y3J2_EUMVA|nr:hypothetical protein EVAR_52807_1 [Eumeta japonica]